MQDGRLRIGALFVGLVGLCFVMTGCGLAGDSLPSSVPVTLPDGSTVTADLGSGVPSLADTAWDVFRVAENAQSVSFVRIRFGPDGNLDGFEDNPFAREIFGATIYFDGARHSTTQQGLEYAAAAYAAETADSTGFTFEGRLKAFAAGLEAGHATATATGEFDSDDPDIIHGTFAFSTRITLLNIPEANQDDEFPYMGRRVVDE